MTYRSLKLAANNLTDISPCDVDNLTQYLLEILSHGKKKYHVSEQIYERGIHMFYLLQTQPM